MAEKLKDAKIKVVVDYREADRVSEERDRRKKDDERRPGGGGGPGGPRAPGTPDEEGGGGGALDAVIRSRRRLMSVLRGLVAFRAGEEVFGGLAGMFREAGKDKIVQPVTDALANRLDALSRDMTNLRVLVGSILSISGSAADFARLQKLLGDVDPEALSEFVALRTRVTGALAEAQARREVIGREALGAAGAQLAEQGKQAILRVLSGAGAHG